MVPRMREGLRIQVKIRCTMKLKKTGAKIRETKMEKGTKKIYLHHYLLLLVCFICDYHKGSLFSADFVVCMSTKILLMMVMMKCFIPIKHSAWL